MISLLAWAGFVASFSIHIATFFQHKFPGAVFALHFLCILLTLAACSAAGLGNRKPTRADCAGVAADLLLLVEPYAILTFAWLFWSGQAKGDQEFLALRIFSTVWMSLFLTSAGLMARASLGIRQFS